jgi:hypothetical protein
LEEPGLLKRNLTHRNNRATPTSAQPTCPAHGNWTERILPDIPTASTPGPRSPYPALSTAGAASMHTVMQTTSTIRLNTGSVGWSAWYARTHKGLTPYPAAKCYAAPPASKLRPASCHRVRRRAPCEHSYMGSTCLETISMQRVQRDYNGFRPAFRRCHTHS